MRINQNISALNAWRNLQSTDGAMSKSLERLSSGLRINRAADDAAGLAISEKMRGQIRGLNQAMRNSQDGISMIQTAEGALTETHSILQRMRELMVQAGNGTNEPEDLQAINKEMDQLVEELDGISDRTEFNGKKLLNGSMGATVNAAGTDNTIEAAFKIDLTGAVPGTYAIARTEGGAGVEDTISLTANGITQTLKTGNTTAADMAVTNGTVFNFDAMGITLTVTNGTSANVTAITGNIQVDAADPSGDGAATLQIGANISQTLSVQIAGMSATDLGLKSGSSLIDVTDFATRSFDTQMGLIDTAISSVSSERSKLGAYQNRLEHTIANVGAAAENITAAESRIRDVDMAQEMASFTRSQILLQAGTAMMAQANQKPQSILQLLR